MFKCIYFIWLNSSHFFSIVPFTFVPKMLVCSNFVARFTRFFPFLVSLRLQSVRTLKDAHHFARQYSCEVRFLNGNNPENRY